ncbi:universal stress protein [Thalassoglobus sp.]|uniref:universal stress protein n=1 Tax=Thalassoglobus sp. TaxID=2795869 RepID=UPI003AA9AB40
MSNLKRDRVVVPVDFSEESQNALSVAVEMAGDATKVHVVHVLPPLEAISPAVVWGELSDDTRKASVKDYATQFLLDHGASGATLEVRVGSPGHEITTYANEIEADLIVISSHGYHGIKRMLLGSVAESVIRHAHCAVLVLRRQDAE